MPSPTPATSIEIAQTLRTQLGALLPGYQLKVEADPESRTLPGIADGVYVSFASVPKGSSELACLNAKRNLMISITAPEWSQRNVATHHLITGTIPTTKVTAHTFTGNTKFRKTSGTPAKVIAAIVAFFAKIEK